MHSKSKKVVWIFSQKLIMKKVLIACLLFFASSAWCIAGNEADNKNFDWEALIQAIIKVESNGNAKAVSGRSVGALQITPVLVQECNRILKQRKSSKRYSLNDRFSVEKSKEMFLLFQSRYNPSNDIEYAIRSWNGGPHYSNKATQRYYNKVMNYYKKTNA